MRSSKILSPSHYNKICDIVVESIIQLYTNKNDLYKSNIFSYIINDRVTVVGEIHSNTHFTSVEILNYVKQQINIDIDIDLFFKKNKLENYILDINSDTFLGYYCNENEYGIPFEQLEALKLSKFLYAFLKLPFVLEVTINGNQIEILIEINYNDVNYIKDKVTKYFDVSNLYEIKIIKVVELDKKILYKSGHSFISNFYGPRVPYGNTNFVGFDLGNNYRYSHLVSREIAKSILKEENLNYCLVELTYHSGDELPIQIGVKGNSGGIYLENGTFFRYIESDEMYSYLKNNIIEDIKSIPTLLVDMAKWGILYQ